MTTPKPRKKPLSRVEATLHAQIRTLQKELAAMTKSRDFFMQQFNRAATTRVEFVPVTVDVGGGE